MNGRISSIRKAIGFNQDAFAEKLGLTKNFISLIETGKRIPSDRTIKDICREFNVNEDWLRNGTGEMFVRCSAVDAYRRAADILGAGEHEMDRLVRGIITKYGDMDETSKDVFMKYLKDLIDEKPRFEVPAQEDLEREYIEKIS